MNTYEVTGIRIDNETGHRSAFTKRVATMPARIEVLNTVLDAADPYSNYYVETWKSLVH